MTTPGSHGPGEQPTSGVPGWGPPAGGQQPGSVPPGSVPPPPNQIPQGQYPPPQGQFPQGQYPPPQGQFGQGQGWTPQPQKKSGAGKWVAIAAGIVGVLVIVVIALAFLGGDPEVGDCLQEDSQELSVVDCDDSAAAWKLIGIQEGEQSYDEYQADPATCSAFPEAVQSFWVGENGDETGQGVVYCVTEN